MTNSLFFYKEIKNRCVIFLLLCVFNAIVCFCNKENILFFLLQSIESSTMSTNETYFVFTDLPEVFSVFIELAAFFTYQLSILLFLYHLIAFFSASFRSVELYNVKKVFRFFVSGWALTFIVFQIVALPSMLTFFLTLPNMYNTMSPYPILFEAKLNQFISFCLSVYMTCLMIVEFCVFNLFLITFKKAQVKNVQKDRKNFYLMVVVIALVMAPFEVLSQMFLVSFILVYWEFMIFARLLLLKEHN